MKKMNMYALTSLDSNPLITKKTLRKISSSSRFEPLWFNSIAMASQSHQLHFVLIPFMSPGHLIPMADMARLLAQQGVVVTIVTTPLNAIGIKPIIDRAIDSGLPIQLVQFTLPLHEFGLPEGCESMDSVPLRKLLWNFFAALDKLQQPVEQLLETLRPSPSCIIADKLLTWTADIARKFGIPRLLFDGTSCFTLLCSHNIQASKVLESVTGSESFVVPDLPDEIELTTSQLPGDLNPGSEDFRALHNKVKEAEEGAYGAVVNSFEELESEYVKEYRKVSRVKVWSIGPVSLSNKTELDKAQRGSMASIDENQCLKWLDSWPQSSVVYVCLGSLSRLTTLQLVELGLGLEASNRPFVWVFTTNQTEEWEKWLLVFEERTKGRALLIQGWSPQILILSHPAVGGFLTHCGWNSTLEGICAGVPMITWPMFAEQFYNEKMIVQVLRIGERVGAEVYIPLGEQEKSVGLVKRSEFKEAIDKVMVKEGNKEGEERRERARKLAIMAKKATEEGGSSYLNITLLIEDIRSYKNK